MATVMDENFEKYSSARHADKILLDAIGDLHCAQKLGREAGVEISTSIFDALKKQREHLTEKMTEYGTKAGMI